jgi:hypothetical protein
MCGLMLFSCTALTAGAVQVVEVPAYGQRLRLNCTAYTSGTVSYELDAPNE